MITRRSYQCRSCDSAATHEVHLHIRYGRRHVATEHLVLNRRVCNSKSCRKKAWDTIFSEGNKLLISVKLATIGRLRLDWPNAMLEFVPLGEDAWGPEKMQAMDPQNMTQLGTG